MVQIYWDCAARFLQEFPNLNRVKVSDIANYLSSYQETCAAGRIEAWNRLLIALRLLFTSSKNANAACQEYLSNLPFRKIIRPSKSGVGEEWQQAIDAFKKDRPELSEATIIAYETCIRQLASHFKSSLSKTTREDLHTFLELFFLIKTRNSKMHALKTFFQFASERYRFENPACKLKHIPEGNINQGRTITAEEFKLISGQKGEIRDWAVFIGNTGLRVSEFCGIRDEHVISKNGACFLRVIGKGKKFRVIPLNKTATALLEKHKPMPFTRSRLWVNTALGRLSRKLDIRVFGPHALRHYFATTLIDKGVNIASVSKLIGHSNIQTTIEYCYYPTDLDGAVGLLDEIKELIPASPGTF